VSSAEADLTNLVFTTVTPTFETQFGVDATMKSRSIDLTDSTVTKDRRHGNHRALYDAARHDLGHRAARRR